MEDNLHEGLHRGSSWFPGLSRQPHSEDFRSRFAALMEKGSRYQNVQKKRNVEFDNEDDRDRRSWGGAAG